MSIIIFWVCLVLFLFLAHLDLIFNSWMKILFFAFHNPKACSGRISYFFAMGNI